MTSRFMFWFAMVAFLAMGASNSMAQETNDRCQRCHGDATIAEKRPETLAGMVRAPESGGHVLRNEEDIKNLFVNGGAFGTSAHATISCDQCHPGIDSLPHGQEVQSLACTSCHTTQSADIEMGRHNPATEGAPRCLDCHGEPHQVAPIKAERDHATAIEMVERCSTCHKKAGAHEFSPADTFHDSIHGEALYKKGLVKGPLCTDCHGTHAILPAANAKSKLHVSNVATTCGVCHQGVEGLYNKSIHGTEVAGGNMDAATCTGCHHSHGIKEVGPEFLSEVVSECSHCHIDLGKSYLVSYHGKATELGSHDVAVCSSCHGAHDILPPEDPASRVNEANLVKTCSECHSDANDQFVKYIAHVDYTDPDTHPAVYYTFWGMTLLLCSVILVFVIHSALWFQRTLIERIRSKPHKEEKPRMIRRFDRIHRLTHGLIVVSFMGLVATGFPIKYSHTEWAQNLAAFFGGAHIMGLIHRFLAIVTFLYAGIHFAFLAYFFVKKCPRPLSKYLFGPDSLIFSLKDLKDLIAMLKWFFRRGPRPRFDRWTYFEKFDYWGEIWGVFVIGGSGLMLWMPTLFTRWLPGWVLNCAMVVHSIEALLAASVIFLVHFFNTHLRPERFPIDMVMWGGQVPEKEMIEERAAEYDRLVETGQLESRIVEPLKLHWRIIGIVLGMSAFMTGIILIILAIRTELLNITG